MRTLRRNTSKLRWVAWHDLTDSRRKATLPPASFKQSVERVTLIGGALFVYIHVINSSDIYEAVNVNDSVNGLITLKKLFDSLLTRVRFSSDVDSRSENPAEGKLAKATLSVVSFFAALNVSSETVATFSDYFQQSGEFFFAVNPARLDALFARHRDKNGQ